MAERLKALWQDLLGRFREMERGNKVRFVSLIVAVLAALGIAIFLAVRPKWVELYSNLDYKTLVEIQDKLSEEGIESKLTGTNNLSVLEKDVNTGRVVVEASDIVSSGKFTYPDALEYSTISTSDKIVTENLRHAKETEIEEMLESFKGVNAANVSLVIPNTTSYFLDLGESKEASAAAVLSVGSSFDKNTGEAMARLISRSVVDLNMDKIEITNQYAEVIYSGFSQQDGMHARTQMEAKERYEERLAQQIRSFLTPFSSQIHTIANIEFDWDIVTEKSMKHDIPEGIDDEKGALSQEETDSSKVSSSESDAEPGLMSNVNQGITYQTGSEGATEAKSDSVKRSYLYDWQETTLEGSVGKMNPELSSLSIMMYNENFIYEDLVTEEDLDGLTWAQYKNINNGQKIPMVVDEGLVNSIQYGTGIDRVALNGYTVTICVDSVIEETPTNQIAMLVVLGILLALVGFALLRATKPRSGGSSEYVPDLSVEDLLVGTKQIESQQRRMNRELEDFEFGQESEMKLLLDDFVDENPEAVAQLLRNWISDDWS